MAFDPTKYAPPVSVAINPTYIPPPRKKVGAFEAGVQSGVKRLPGSALTLRAVLREQVLGDTGGALADLREAQQNFEHADTLAPDITPVDQWKSLSDATDSTLGMIGQMIPDMAMTLGLSAVGGLGGIAARSAIGAAAKVGAATVAKAGTAIQAGAVTGAVTGSMVSQGGEVGRKLTDPGILQRAERTYASQLAQDTKANPYVRGIARVGDADTIDILDPATGVKLKTMRLPGINSADIGQEGYAQATEYLRNMVDGKMVSASDGGRGAYGRDLGQIYTDDSDESLSERLLRGGQVGVGAARHIRAQPTYYEQLEAEGQQGEGALPIFGNRRFTAVPRDPHLLEEFDIGEGPAALGDMTDDVLLGMAAAAGLDLLPMLRAVNKFLPGSGSRIAREAVDSLGKRVVKEAGIQTVFEGVTEATQTVIERAVARELDSNIEVFSDEGISEILTAGVLGGLVGGIFGGVGGIPNPSRNVEKTGRAPLPENLDIPASPVPTGFAPPAPSGAPGFTPQTGEIAPETGVQIAPKRESLGTTTQRVPSHARESASPQGVPWEAGPDVVEISKEGVGTGTVPRPGSSRGPLDISAGKPGSYLAKDIAKAKQANKFIGQGSPNSATASYARVVGNRANTGQYTSSDAVFVSAEGGRRGRIPVDVNELSRATNAGATIITDDAANRNRGYNVGEREVATHLTEQGYVEAKPGRWEPSAPVGPKSTLDKAAVSALDNKVTPTPRVEGQAQTTTVVQGKRGPKTIISTPAVNEWAVGERSIELADASGATLTLPPLYKTRGLVQYTAPGSKRVKNIPAYALYQYIQQDPKNIDTKELFRLAHLAEPMHHKKDPKKQMTFFVNPKDPALRDTTSLAKGATMGVVAESKEADLTRTHPLLDYYGGEFVTFKTVKGDNPSGQQQHKEGLDAVFPIMQKRGLYPAMFVDDKLGFMPLKQRNKFYKEIGVAKAMNEDGNILGKLGALTKRAGGQSEQIEVADDMQLFDQAESDGTIGIIPTLDEGVIQGTWTVRTKDGGHRMAKGVVRRPLRFKLSGNRAYTESAAFDKEFALDKQVSVGDAGRMHTMKSLVDRDENAQMSYQGALAGFSETSQPGGLSAAEFIQQSTRVLQDLFARDRLTTHMRELFDAGMPLNVLKGFESPIELLKHFKVPGARALAFGAREHDNGLKRSEYDPKTGVVKPGGEGEVALLPRTRRILEDESGVKLIPGKTKLVIHREPALIDGSATNIFIYAGDAQFDNSTPSDFPLPDKGVVFNGKDPLNVLMGLDFDGDVVLVWPHGLEGSPQINDILVTDKPLDPLNGKDPVTGKNYAPPDTSIKVAEDGSATGMEQAIRNLFDGFSTQIGRAIVPARVIAAMGRMTPEIANKSQVAAHGTIGAKKKATDKKRGNQYFKDLKAEAKKLTKLRTESGGSVLDYDMSAVQALEPWQQEKAFGDMVTSWKGMLKRNVEPALTPFERAMIQRAEVVHRIMQDNDLYAKAKGKEKIKPPLMQRNIDAAYKKEDPDTNGTPFVQPAAHEYRKLLMELGGVPSRTEDGSINQQYTAMNEELQGIAAAVNIQYKLDNLSAAALLKHMPLRAVKDIISVEDLKVVHPDGNQKLSLRFLNTEGTTQSEGTPLAPGLYAAVRPTDDGGYIVRHQNPDGTSEKLTIYPTSSDGMHGWTRGFLDNTHTFAVEDDTLSKPTPHRATATVEQRVRKLHGRPVIGRDGKPVTYDYPIPKRKPSRQYMFDRVMDREDAAVPAAWKERYDKLRHATEVKTEDSSYYAPESMMTPAQVEVYRSAERQQLLGDIPEYVDAVTSALGFKHQVVILNALTDSTVIGEVGGDLALPLLNNEIGGFHVLKGGRHYIAMANNTMAGQDLGMYHLLSHELGHAIVAEHGATAAMQDAHKEWHKEWKGRYDAAGPAERDSILVQAFESIARKPGDVRGALTEEYVFGERSYDEWFAENVAAWFNTDKKPQNLVERVFHDIARALRVFFQKLRGDGHYDGKHKLPDASVAQFMSTIWDDSASVTLEHAVEPALTKDTHALASAGVITPEQMEAINEQLAAHEPTLEVGAASREARLGEKFIRAQVLDDVVEREAMAVELGYLFVGTQEDQMVGFVAAYNNVFTDEERGVLSKALLSPAARFRAVKETGDTRIYTDTTYAAAVAWTRWLRGDLKLGPQSDNVFMRLYKLLTNIMGVVTNTERADQLLRFLRDRQGEMSTLAERLENPGVRIIPPSQVVNTKTRLVTAVSRAIGTEVHKAIKGYTQQTYTSAGFAKNPAIRDIMAMFHNNVWERDREIDIFSAKQEHSFRFYNQYAKIGEQFKKDPAMRKKILKAWYGDEVSSDPKVRMAVTQLRALMDNMRNYAVTRGIDIGKVDRYVPWVFDTKVLEAKGTEFKKLVIKHAPEDFWRQEVYFDNKTQKRQLRYKMDKDAPVTDDMKVRGADAIYNAILAADGDTSMDFNDAYVLHTPYMGAHETRILSFLPQEDVGQFLSGNLDYVVHTYVHQLVARAEYVKRFGLHGEKLNKLMARARGFGANDEDIAFVQRVIDGNMGTLGLNQPGLGYGKGARTAAKTIITYENFRLLGLSGVTQLADAAGILWKTGNFADTAVALIETIRSYKKNGGDLKRIQELVGAASNDAVLDTLAWGFGMQDMQGAHKKFSNSWFNDKLFAYNGTKKITQFMRTWALSAGRTQIVEWHKKGDKRSKGQLSHLGLQEGDIQLTEHGNLVLLQPDQLDAMYKRAAEARDQSTTDIEAEAAIAREERVRGALTRVVDESNIRPTAATRPVEANDQNIAMMLVYHLQSFMWGFWELFTKRTLLNLRYIDRGRGIQQALSLSMFVVLYMFAEVIRDLIQHGFDDDPAKRGWDEWDMLVYGTLSAGTAGPFEFLARGATESEQGGFFLEAFAGPTGQHAIDNLRSEGDIGRSMPLQNVFGYHIAEFLK